MTRGRMAITGALLLVAALLLSSCSGDQGASKGDPVDGKRLFASSGCVGCHTFKAAGSAGTRGPDLDAASPSVGRVMRQLEHPGGLMPNFADKLSDSEKRNLAAFVGAPNSSGKAVAAPFRADSKRLSDCRDGSFECLEQAFGNLTYNEGPKIALARLQSMTSSDTAVAADCHRIAHRMGSAALSRFRDKVAPAFIAGSPVCASGYYHGIIERAFLGQPTDKLGVVARQLCTDPQIADQRFLEYQCIHGLGHGLMIYTGYDMPGSLKTCDGLQTDFGQVSCSGGVFMENFSSSYGVTSKYLRKNDPIYPCDAVAEHYKAQCYGLVTANLLNRTGYDQKQTAAGCRRSEPRWVGVCFESFGRDVSGMAGRSASKALASCRLAEANEDDCLYGVAREIVNSDAGGARGARFCAQAPKRHRGRCYSGIGSVMASIETTQDRLRAACRRLGGRYERFCLQGAGLVAVQQP
ncbi:MAG TPA: cytochrome c [Solirubrobacteraceae bacterium]|nr:cytochrome c [Solirubrobacteraceae bacterium]